jgi:signal transduction histidine kinase
VKSSPIKDKDGRIIAAIEMVEDITERKQAEERLKIYSGELQEINEDLKSFASIVSHDLRAPLVNIKGFAGEFAYVAKDIRSLIGKHLDRFEQAERRKLSALLEKDIPEALEFIGSSVNRMDNQISAILKLSRAGRRTLNPEPLQTGEVVQGILRTLTHQLESRAVTVTVGALPDLVADRTAMEQIFGNLLDNAVKYLDPSRPGEIAVTAEPGLWEVVFRVRDNGRGMAQEDIPKAFEIFRRVGKQDMPGDGMGLAYVKALVRSLGGRIWCKSESGVGTTFSFALPGPIDESGELLSMIEGGRP